MSGLYCARRRVARQGFTLVELLVVITIIGILAIGFAAFIGAFPLWLLNSHAPDAVVAVLLVAAWAGCGVKYWRGRSCNAE